MLYGYIECDATALALIIIQSFHRWGWATWDIEITPSFVHALATSTCHGLNLGCHPTSFQDLFPASFGEFFGVLDVVGNKRFGVVTRKLTNIFFDACKKHLEGTFNLYIYAGLIVHIDICSHGFAYTCSWESESAYKISIVDTGFLTPLDEWWKNLYNEVGFKNVDRTLCAWCVNVSDHVKNCEKSQLVDIQYIGQILGHVAVLGCRYSPEGRSIFLYCPLRILSNSGWLFDEFITFEEILDNLNRSAAKERPFGI